MVASRQVEILFYRGLGRDCGRGFGVPAQVIGRTEILFFRKKIVPAAKRVRADLLEFAAPEIVETVRGKKYFKTVAKSVGRQTLKKQVVSCRRRRISSRSIPTNSAKQITTGIFTNISCQSCQRIFSPNLLWQLMEILEGKFQ